MPTNWPDPPWFEHYVLEDPLPLAIMLGVAAVIVFLAGGRMGKRKWQLAALIPLGLAGLAVLTAVSVETDREKILVESRRLVEAATSPFDLTAVEQLTAPTFTMKTPDGKIIVDGRAKLLEAIKRAERSMTIESNTLTNHMERIDTPGEGAVYLAIFSQTRRKLGQQAAPTRWILRWKKSTDGSWLLTGATWLEVAGTPVTGWMLP